MTFDQVKDLYQKHGFKFYDTGKYNVNNFGIRNKDLTVINQFNDVRGVAYIDGFGVKQCLTWAATTKPGLVYLKDKVGNPNGTAILIPGYYTKCWIIGKHNIDGFGVKQCLTWAATTKPGLTYLKDKVGNPNGTAILIPGYYVKCWVIGKHNIGKEHEHEALIQSGPSVFKVWRDNDSDGQFDFEGPIYTDSTGVNDHTTREHDINNVGAFSAGCQVTQDDKEHMIKMAICKRSAELYGNSFSYALFQD